MQNDLDTSTCTGDILLSGDDNSEMHLAKSVLTVKKHCVTEIFHIRHLKKNLNLDNLSYKCSEILVTSSQYLVYLAQIETRDVNCMLFGESHRLHSIST